ncbi:MAG TPA: hypothetical protein VD885_06725, partial [Methylophilaceae bacterium]|nr:hypothetical protein [Methylophilaceae bacterium]
PDGVEFEYLANKFSHGLSLPNEDAVPLDKIVLFSSTCINASHLSSAMDVVLGSWRYCINQPANNEVAQSMMKAITKLIWCERNEDRIYAFEKGLVFRPKTISVKRYQQKYNDLLKSINKLLND